MTSYLLALGVSFVSIAPIPRAHGLLYRCRPTCVRRVLPVLSRTKFDTSKSKDVSKTYTTRVPGKKLQVRRSDGRRPGDCKFPPGKLPFALELDYVLNHPIADAAIAALVTLNCLLFTLQTIDVGPRLHDTFVSYEQNISIMALVEYVGRWYGKGLSPRFLLTRGMIIDFIAVSPFAFAYGDESEALYVRILRLSRILRIQRVVMDTDRSAEVMGALTKLQIRLASIGLSLFSLLYVSAGLFYQVEKDVNPNVLNFFDAFYFSTITLFTVGFGDVTPFTSWGRASTFFFFFFFSNV